MLQSTKTTVGRMIEAVEMCVKNLDYLRNMDSFKEIYESAEELFEQNDLDPIPMERPRKLPRKIYQGESNHSSQVVQKFGSRSTLYVHTS